MSVKVQTVKRGRVFWTRIGREVVEVVVDGIGDGPHGAGFRVYRKWHASNGRAMSRTLAELFNSATAASLSGKVRK